MPIIAAPYSLPFAPPPVSWAGLSAMTWTGANGDTWDLIGREIPSGVLLGEGVRGLGVTRADRFTATSPTLAGSRWRGSRTLEREVFWPLMVFADAGGSQAWVEHDRKLWATLRPELTGTWLVSQPNGVSRSLMLRFVDDGDPSSDIDPTRDGWAVYGVTLVAEQPYWVGTPIIKTWAAGTPVQFFDAAGSPPFHISPGSTTSGAKIDNPGDVEVYPVWTLTGPITTAAVGVAGHVVEYDVAIPEGETRTIDTRPDQLTVVDQAGVDKVADLGEAEFVPVPAGDMVAVDITIVGNGSVSMSLSPLYHRAW